MNQNKLVALGVVVAIVLLVLATCFTIVEPGHRGVRVTLGKVAPEPVAEGLAIKMPLGITHVRPISVQQQTREGQAQCFSSDLQTVGISYAVMYRIPETQVVSLFQDYQGDPYLTLIAPRLQEAMKQVTALYKAEDLVQNREGTRSETVKRLQLSVGELVQIVDVNIVNIDLTDELERAIEAKMVQQQDALKKQFELERERTEAEITLVKARAEAEASKVRGEALANAPRVIEMEIIKKWNGIAPSVVVLGEGGAGANVMLPMIPPTPRE